jgi:ubiquinone/menaquinone biosynthesis C-methylase UbiE
MTLLEAGLQRRAARALERQLDYQRKREAKLKSREERLTQEMRHHSARIRAQLEAVRPIADDAPVLEVGSGAHGIIFFFGTSQGFGVDPLADHYREMFPDLHARATTVAAPGEDLPFPDASFDVVLCDNVVDHAQNPRLILEEIVRVMKPGALLFFEVNVHHPIYHAAASVHAGWRALGVPFEITPFADHTYHFTRKAAARLFDGLPLSKVSESDTISEEIRRQRAMPLRRPSDVLKRAFFKNAAYEVVAQRW